jgi:hypothetical protein
VRLVVLAALLLALAPRGAAAADYAPGEPLQRITGARADFALHCRGCHGLAGEGTAGHVPRLDGFVGLFTRVADGRDYLMRVPGVARAALDDARLAAVLNWMLATYGGAQVAPGFRSYTADEVGAARRQVLRDRKRVRDRLLEALRARSLIGSDEDGLGVSAEQRG